MEIKESGESTVDRLTEAGILKPQGGKPDTYRRYFETKTKQEGTKYTTYDKGPISQHIGDLKHLPL